MVEPHATFGIYCTNHQLYILQLFYCHTSMTTQTSQHEVITPWRRGLPHQDQDPNPNTAVRVSSSQHTARASRVVGSAGPSQPFSNRNILSYLYTSRRPTLGQQVMQHPASKTDDNILRLFILRKLASSTPAKGYLCTTIPGLSYNKIKAFVLMDYKLGNI